MGLPGEEMVASYLYQVHLYLWLEINDYGSFLVDTNLGKTGTCVEISRYRCGRTQYLHTVSTQGSALLLESGVFFNDKSGRCRDNGRY